MSRVRRIRDKNGHSVYYDVETMKRNSKMIQNDEGIFWYFQKKSQARLPPN